MFPGINPKKMQAMMKQMGISQEEIPASKVIIEKTDSTKIVIDNPSVTRISMQGQESFQVSGEIKEEAKEEENNISSSEDDIKTIMEKTGCNEEEARKAMEETGDLAEAILKLS
jgi:nascent polypeptide-associated complex subunit alpha